MPAIESYSPDPSKRRLKISIRYHDSGAVFHQVRYLDNKLTNEDVLELMWCEWNRGSQRESQRFLNAQVRNMMVSDTISIQGGGVRGPTRHYICEMVGWRELGAWPGDDEDIRTIDKAVSRVAL
jgi:hypothetical protein